MDTRPRTPFISFCTVQLQTLYVAHSLATLCLCMTSGPDPGELPGFWGSMVFHHAPIPWKGSGKQQQHHIMPGHVLWVVDFWRTSSIFPQCSYSMNLRCQQKLAQLYRIVPLSRYKLCHNPKHLLVSKPITVSFIGFLLQ